MLAREAQKVIELWLVRLAWGRRDGRAEATLMIIEKIGVAVAAAETLMSGGSPSTVVSRYREHVAAEHQAPDRPVARRAPRP